MLRLYNIKLVLNQINLLLIQKTDVNVALAILQAGIDRRVQLNTVDVDGKFKINATSNDILKIQKIDGTTLYDSCELSFNLVDNTSILKTNNVNILQAINNNAVAVNGYSETESDISLNLKADKTDNYPKADVNVALTNLQAGIDRRVQIRTVNIDGKFKINATSDTIFKIQKVDGISLYDAVELSFNMTDQINILKT